jgi:TRAP-type C4-dicarboxylate transport system substrate-binding protein
MRPTYCAILAAAAIVSVSTTAALSKPRIIRFDSYAGTQHAVNANGLTVWAKEVEKASHGELKVEINYPPVNPRDFLDRVRNGISDAAWITNGYTTGRFVLTQMVELPGSGGHAEQTSRADWNVYTKEFSSLGEYKGVVPIALFTHGPGMIHTRKPINTIGDLKGLKIRTGGGIQAEIASRLGMVTVSAPATKAEELLSQGVADGIMFSLETIKSFHLENLVTHHYGMPDTLYTSSMAFVINKKFLDSLSDQQKKALWSVSGEKLSALVGRAWDSADLKALNAIDKNSVVIFHGKIEQQIRSALAGMDQEWIERAKKAGAKDPGKVLKEYRELVAKYVSRN